MCDTLQRALQAWDWEVASSRMFRGTNAWWGIDWQSRWGDWGTQRCRKVGSNLPWSPGNLRGGAAHTELRGSKLLSWYIWKQRQNACGLSFVAGNRVVGRTEISYGWDGKWQILLGKWTLNPWEYLNFRDWQYCDCMLQNCTQLCSNVLVLSPQKIRKAVTDLMEWCIRMQDSKRNHQTNDMWKLVVNHISA